MKRTFFLEWFMKRVGWMMCGGAAVVAVLVGVSGCGVSEKSLAQAQQRLDTLVAKGIPDSLLSDAKVFLFQAKGAQERGNSREAATNADSALVYIDKAEKAYGDAMENIKPKLVEQRSALGERRSALSGPQLHKADSLLAQSDSLLAGGLVMQAAHQLQQVEQRFEQLRADEQNARELLAVVAGSWQAVLQLSGEGAQGVEKRSMSFGRDGTLAISEERLGRSSEALREDWKFLSWGEWELMGDTILMHIKREQCVKQDFYNLVNGSWQKKSGPIYDSTLSDRSKDRFMVVSDLKADFKRR
jgi:hypothetical protein